MIRRDRLTLKRCPYLILTTRSRVDDDDDVDVDNDDDFNAFTSDGVLLQRRSG